MQSRRVRHHAEMYGVHLWSPPGIFWARWQTPIFGSPAMQSHRVRHHAEMYGVHLWSPPGIFWVRWQTPIFGSPAMQSRHVRRHAEKRRETAFLHGGQVPTASMHLPIYLPV
jgi:hypothetical protein